MAEIVPNVSTLVSEDRARWTELWNGYLTFYQKSLPAEISEMTWATIARAKGPIFGVGARDAGGRLVGIAHYLFHPSSWSLTDLCYLEDLFVDPDERGRGIARHLIEAVASAARECGSSDFYWMTKEDNTTARALYDKVASFGGFIRYEHPL